MILKDPQVFRDLFTSFIFPSEDVPPAILVDGKRYELIIVYDSNPLRFAIRGAHDLVDKEVFPCR